MNYRRIPGLPENDYVARPTVPAMRADAFAVCPLALIQGQSPVQQSWQSALYQLAFEQARAVLEPSLLERDLLGVWN
jgi:hypothetical protein